MFSGHRGDCRLILFVGFMPLAPASLHIPLHVLRISSGNTKQRLSSNNRTVPRMCLECMASCDVAGRGGAD